jgi:hypothetical protein
LDRLSEASLKPVVQDRKKKGHQSGQECAEIFSNLQIIQMPHHEYDQDIPAAHTTKAYVLDRLPPILSYGLLGPAACK